MKEVPLTRGMTALVDDADYELVMRYKWRPCPDQSNPPKYRAITHTTKKRDGRMGGTISMHRLLMGMPPSHIHVDHKNRNALDNRRENLRFATPLQNSRNQSVRTDRKIPYKGVSKFPTHYLRKPYFARIKDVDRTIHLGFFADPADAARAYDAKAKELYGEFACLNFPESETATA